MEKKHFKNNSKLLENMLNDIFDNCEEEIPIFLTKHYVEQAVERFGFDDISQFELMVPTHFTKGKISKLRVMSGPVRDRDLLVINYGQVVSPFCVYDYKDRIKIVGVTIYGKEGTKLKSKMNSPLEDVYVSNKKEIKLWLTQIA